MVDVFKQHLENLGVTGWTVLILLSLVVYLYDENQSLRQSKNSIIDYLLAKHAAEMKQIIENKKEAVKTPNADQPKSHPLESDIDCEFPF